MDWYNIAPVAVGAGAVVASYFGARSAARRSITRAEKARANEWSVEHARWIRERRSDIYVDTIAIREFRAMLRSRSLRDVLNDEPELEPPSTASAGVLFARMHLWGSERAVGLLQQAFIAEQRCVNLHAEWRMASEDPMSSSQSTASLRHDVDEALMAADVADESLIEYLREEIQRPMALAPTEANHPLLWDARPMPGQRSTVDVPAKA